MILIKVLTNLCYEKTFMQVLEESVKNKHFYASMDTISVESETVFVWLTDLLFSNRISDEQSAL